MSFYIEWMKKNYIVDIDFVSRTDKNGFGKKLKHLDLTGCLFITDLTLERLAPALSQVTSHMTESDHMTNDDDDTMEEAVEDFITEGEPMEETAEEIVTEVDENVANKEAGVQDCTSKLDDDDVYDDDDDVDGDDDDENVENKDDIPVNMSEPDNENDSKNKKPCCKGMKSCDESNVHGFKNEKDVYKNSTPKNETCCQNTPVSEQITPKHGTSFQNPTINEKSKAKNERCCQNAPINKQYTPKHETCCPNPTKNEKTKPKNESCCQNTPVDEKFLPKYETCCQNATENQKSTPKIETCCQYTSGCIKNYDIGKKENPCETGPNISLDKATKDGTEWKSRVGKEEDSPPEKVLKRLIRCVNCGKVDEIIGGFSEEDEGCGSCHQERLSNHGNQTQCCHGRASVATDRDVGCQGRPKLKGGINVDETKNQGSNSSCLPCQGIVSHCCQGTNVLKDQGEGQSQYDPSDSQENISNNPKTETAIREYGLETKNDETENHRFLDKFHTQCQGLASRSDALDSGIIGTGDPGDLGSLALLDNQLPMPGTNANIKDSLSSYELGQIQTLVNWTNSGTLNDSGPVQTKLPMIFIMDDLDLEFGMNDPDETIKDDPDEVSTDPKKTVEEGMKIDSPLLEFLSLSGCYQITDDGLR